MSVTPVPPSEKAKQLQDAIDRVYAAMAKALRVEKSAVR